ncbi:MAG: homocysteine S-methyltransferase family protein [Eubacteriales bacterium]|nr:homocysteine S-methyltransferase family protein [Eubacteriales bacterium]
MLKPELDALLAGGFLLGDGSTGAELSRRGMPAGVSPELWVLENPDVFIQMQQEYIAAGAQFVLSPTFVANPIKLAHYGVGEQAEEINTRLVTLSRRAAGDRALVAVDLGPTGEFIKPLGTLSLDDIIDCYKRQIRGVLAAQPDFFMLETFMDVSEARAAVLAIKESCDLPFLVSMTFDPSGRTLTGATPQAVAATFTALGASAVGCNCSGGPDSLKAILAAMREVTNLPLIAKPNAGLPEVVNGETVFRMGPDAFVDGMRQLIALGATVVGGCCGTNPDHIAALRDALADLRPAGRPAVRGIWASSQRKAVCIGAPHITVIGERINPSGKSELIQELKDLYPDTAMDMAREQQAQGAEILDINAGGAGIDEQAALCMLVEELSQSTTAPFALDSTNADALCAALRLYPGSALLNSIVPGPDAQRLFAAAALYGSTPVLMPMANYKLPATARERLDALTELLDIGACYGFTVANVLVDVVTPPAATAWDTLRQAADFASAAAAMGCTVVAGISNVSFGLPKRAQLNKAWLTALVSRGLRCAILNPTKGMMDTLHAARVIAAEDEYCLDYIGRSRD